MRQFYRSYVIPDYSQIFDQELLKRFMPRCRRSFGAGKDRFIDTNA
jgi:hypothetical protein